MGYNVSLFENVWIVTSKQTGEVLASLREGWIRPSRSILDDEVAFAAIVGLLHGIRKGLEEA